jgi:uncharacterized protein (DUF2147 family)
MHTNEYTLYFWKCGALITVPWMEQTVNQLAKAYKNVPCMRVSQKARIYEFGRYTYLGWRMSNARIPKPLKTLQLILMD